MELDYLHMAFINGDWESNSGSTTNAVLIGHRAIARRGSLPRKACSRGVEGEENFGPTGLGIIWRSAGVPLNCGLILSNQWGPPQLPGFPKQPILGVQQKPDARVCWTDDGDKGEQGPGIRVEDTSGYSPAWTTTRPPSRTWMFRSCPSRSSIPASGVPPVASASTYLE